MKDIIITEVYIPAALRGQGIVAQRIAELRSDPEVNKIFVQACTSTFEYWQGQDVDEVIDSGDFDAEEAYRSEEIVFEYTVDELEAEEDEEPDWD